MPSRARLRLVPLVTATLCACSSSSERPETHLQQALSIVQSVPELSSVSTLDIDHFGPWTSRVAIEVPAARGVEPTLALTYNSAGGDGVIGHGWSISGHGAIERKSASMGIADMTGSDRYFLDGAELRHCDAATATTVSCSSFGNFYFVDENFARVRFDDVNFRIGTADGNEAVYAKSPGNSGWRWHLARVTDRNGNSATYNVNVRSGHEFLDSIEYGYDAAGTAHFRVELHYEGRPDVLDRAGRDGRIHINQRLSAVAVLSEGQLVRAYNVAYEPAGSFVRSIEQVAGSALLGPDGRYTGDALPGVTYQRGVPFSEGFDDTFHPTVTVPAPSRVAGVGDEVDFSLAAQLSTLPANARLSWSTATLDRDGVPDVTAVLKPVASFDPNDPPPTTDLLTVRAPRTITNNASVPVVRTPTTLGVGAEILRPDFDGDGLSDLVAIDRQTVTIARALPDGSLTWFPAATISQLPLTDNRFLLGDFDGDGRTDILSYSRRKDTMFEQGTTTPCQAESWSCDLVGEKFVLIHVEPSGAVTFDTFIGPVSSLWFTDRWTQIGIPHPVQGFATLVGDAVLPYPEWTSADLDGDRVPEVIRVEAVVDPSAFTHVKLRITPHFLGETAGGGALQLIAAPTLEIWNYALIDGPILWGQPYGGIATFTNPADLTGRLLWGELNGDGRQDLLVERPTDVGTHTEGPTTSVPELTLSPYYSRGDGTFGSGTPVHLGQFDITADMIPTWGPSATQMSEDPNAAVPPFLCTALACRVLNRALDQAFTLLQADLNADGIDDLFLAEEQAGLGFVDPQGFRLEADVRTWTLIWGPQGIAEEREDVWGAGSPPRAVYMARSQANHVFVDGKFGWLVADFNVDGVNDIGWLDFSDTDDVGVMVYPQSPRVDTPQTARWVDISGEGHTDLVRVGALQTQITSAVRTQTGTSVATAPITTGRADELVIGDFGSATDTRADGKTDFAWVTPTGGAFPATETHLDVAYAMGNGQFTVIGSDVAGVSFNGNEWLAADLDGDRTDEIVQVVSEATTTTVRAARRTGATAWVNASSAPLPVGEPAFGGGRWRTAHLTGGDHIDFIRVTPGAVAGSTALQVDMLIQTGAGWTTDAQAISRTMMSPSRIDRGLFQLGDANGDGLGDLVRISRNRDHQAGTLVVSQLISTGRTGMTRFADDPFTVQAPATEADAELSLAAWQWTDLDNDGLEDAVQVARGLGTSTQFYDYIHVLHRTGTASATWDRHRVVGANASNYQFRDDVAAWTLADFVGTPLGTLSDGQIDLVRPVQPVPAAGQPPDGAMGVELYGVDLPRPVVRVEQTGYGLRTELTYASSKGHHDGVPGGAGEYDVVRVHRSVEPTGDYSDVEIVYDGFRYDHANRRSLGYATATATSSALNSTAAPSLRVTIAQDPVCAGRRVLADRRIARQETEYRRDTSKGNQICTVSAEITRNEEHGGSAALTRTRYERNDDGSVTDILDDGNFVDDDKDDVDDDGGDNRHTRIVFAPRNVTYADYLVGLPEMTTRLDHNGAEIGKERFYYDGQGFGAVPIQGNPTRREQFDDVHGSWPATATTYWPNGAPRTIEGPTGVWEETTYDPTLGLYPEETCNAKFCSKQRWNLRYGKVEMSTDQNGEKTSYTYDDFGRLTRTQFHDGACLMYTWGDLGDPKRQYSFEGVCRTPNEEPSISSSLGVVTYFDGMSRPWRQTRGGTYERLTSYWGTTTLVHRSEPWHFIGSAGAVTETFYEDAGRPVRIGNPDGSERRMGYWVRQVASEDENASAHLFEYDARGKLVVAHEFDANAGGASQSAQYAYDAADRLVTATDPLGNNSTSRYNSLGWIMQSCDPDRGCIDFDYNAAGQLVLHVDTRGMKQALVYDGLGRLEKRTTERNGIAVELERRYWDVDRATGNPSGFSVGRAVEIVGESGSTTLQYDTRGRPELVRRCTETLGNTACAAWQTEYNVMGRIDTIRYPDTSDQVTSASEAVHYSYDDFGRVSRIDSNFDVYLSDATYDPNDRLETAVLGNGVVEKYGYDPKRPWQTSLSVMPTSGTGLELSYEYDLGGRPTRFGWTDANNHELRFGYDTLDRLTEVTGELAINYTYDELGRITDNSALGIYVYAGGNLHAVTHAGPLKLDYDAAGNARGIDQSRYEWDEDGRLVAGKTPAGDVTFGYTPEGTRVYKTVDGKPLYYFGGIVEEELSGDRKCLYKLGERVIAERSHSTVHWLHTDLLGSTRALSEPSGKISDQFDYAPFGEEYRSGSQRPPFGFGAGKFDDETGLTLLGARYYHPQLGRFVSADNIIPSLENPQSHDRYAYAFNTPTKMIDPSGHAPIEANKAQQRDLEQQQQKEPEAPPKAEDFCKTHPDDPSCLGPDGEPLGPVPIKKVDPQLAALAIHVRKDKKGQDDAESWNVLTAITSMNTKLRNLLNEGTWTEQAVYQLSEDAGFNSWARAGTGKDALNNPLSLDQRAYEFIEGTGKVGMTAMDIATVVEGVGLLTRGAGKAAVGGGLDGAGAVCDGGVCPCFAAGTPVQTEHGPRAIETIEAGDVVYAYDPATGLTSSREVTRTYVKNAATLALDLEAWDGTDATVRVTEDHPFLTCDGTFVGAASLHKGDCITTPGAPAHVVRVGEADTSETVYNLEVETDHTYVVGDAWAVVHNTCSFSTGRPPHVADVSVYRNGELVYEATVVSGNMTAAEKALGFPKSALATHTENRLARQEAFKLQKGDTMVINGQYRPCPSCRGAMNRAGRESGANIHYLWEDKIWSARRR